MKASIASQLYTILKSRHSQSGYEWTDANAETFQQNYSVVFHDKPDAFGLWLRSVIVKRFEWRPRESAIEALYLEWLGFDPDPHSLFAKIMQAVDQHGLYAYPSTVEGFMVEGPPPSLLSQPGVNAILGRLGGWGDIVATEDRNALRKRFMDVYKGVAEAAKSSPKLIAPPCVSPKLISTGMNQLEGDAKNAF